MNSYEGLSYEGNTKAIRRCDVPNWFLVMVSFDKGLHAFVDCVYEFCGVWVGETGAVCKRAGGLVGFGFVSNRCMVMEEAEIPIFNVVRDGLFEGVVAGNAACGSFCVYPFGKDVCEVTVSCLRYAVV